MKYAFRFFILIAICVTLGTWGGAAQVRAENATQPADIDPQGTTANACVDLTLNLRYKDTDAKTDGQVSQLQDYLISQGYMGGVPTGYFGVLTFAAAKKIQRAYGFAQTGYVGPLTRGKIKELSCSTTTGESSDVNIYKKNVIDQPTPKPPMPIDPSTKPPVSYTTPTIVVPPSAPASPSVVTESPRIVLINPASSKAGGTITITGSRFNTFGANTVLFKNQNTGVVGIYSGVATIETDLVVTVPTTLPAGPYEVILNNQKNGSNGFLFKIEESTPTVRPYNDDEVLWYLEQAARNRPRTFLNLPTETDFDVNNDNRVDLADTNLIRIVRNTSDAVFDLIYKRITKILDSQIGKTKADPAFIDELDVNRDGTISSSDKEAILRVLKGNRIYPPVTNLIPQPASSASSSSATATTTSFVSDEAFSASVYQSILQKINPGLYR